jgi:hypothetical protein
VYKRKIVDLTEYVTAGEIEEGINGRFELQKIEAKRLMGWMRIWTQTTETMQTEGMGLQDW